jgi:RNA-directed DNA polymerase
LAICGTTLIHAKYPSLTLFKIEALSRERVNGLRHTYHDIISVENLLISWREFLQNKKKRKDAAQFSLFFMDNLITLCRDLVEKTYRHGGYHSFMVNDPKPRDIHKASVRDRLVHHAVCRILSPYFDRKFIFDSYSSRKGKGTHKAMDRFMHFTRQVSRNHTRTAWVLKCDIRKFFANIDHEILKTILQRHIQDKDTLSLVSQIVDSFETVGKPRVGLPLGNLTSQLLVNVYMNEFDQYIKRVLKINHYVRFADDFVFVHENKECLENLLPKISTFLGTRLNLSLHPDKVFIKTLASGIDFLGWVHFPHHRILRTTTKRRMFKKLKLTKARGTIISYVGLMSHGNTHKLSQRVSKQFT